MTNEPWRSSRVRGTVGPVPSAAGTALRSHPRAGDRAEGGRAALRGHRDHHRLPQARHGPDARREHRARGARLLAWCRIWPPAWSPAAATWNGSCSASTGSRIREVFVVGGDADPPAGDYADAGDLLEELARLAHPFTRVGIGGYPEGHPLIPDDRLLEALRRKQPFASYLVTQLCFDAGALATWVTRHPRRRRRPARGRRPARRRGAAQAGRDLAQVRRRRLAALPAQARPPDRHAGALAPLRPDAAGGGGRGVRRGRVASASTACTSSPSTRWSPRGTGSPALPDAGAPARPAIPACTASAPSASSRAPAAAGASSSSGRLGPGLRRRAPARSGARVTWPAPSPPGSAACRWRCRA